MIRNQKKKEKEEIYIFSKEISWNFLKSVKKFYQPS